MTGVDIIGTILRGGDAVLAFMPARQIKGGALGANAPLPSLLVRSISHQEWQPLRPGAHVRHTERIAVTVRAADYEEQRTAMRLAADACRGQIGTIAGALRVAVSPAGRGPEVMGPGDTFERTIDFRVTYETPA